MQPYDILMIGVLVATTVFGAIKGIAWQLAAIASLVASYFVALCGSPMLAPLFGEQAPWNRFAAMALLYILSGAIIWYLFRFVSDFVNRLKLKEFDHQLGAVFGAAKGVGFCVLLTFFAVTLSEQARESVLQSRSGHYISVLLNRAEGVMPVELHALLDPYMRRLEDELRQPAGAPAAKSAVGPASPRS